MAEPNAPADHRPLTSRKAVGAAVMGNLLEWYDFAIYGYLATIVARNFFPKGDEVTALLSTFATFGVGFVVRPLGGILIGRLGDARGRKNALMLTIFLMACGTVLIGLVPAYDAIGLWAPALLVAARLLQGFAAGGEWGGSTAFIVEWAPRARRALRQLPTIQPRRGAAARFRHRRPVQHRAYACGHGILGLAHSLPARRHPGAGGHLHAA